MAIIANKFSNTSAIQFIVKVDKKGYVFSYANNIFAEKLGVKKYYLLGLDISCVFKNDLGSKIINICKDSIKRGKSSKRNVVIDLKFGRYILKVSDTEKKMHYSLVCFHGTKLSNTSVDDTCNQVIDTLETSHYYDICQTSRNAVFVLDVIDEKEFSIGYVNPAFEKLIKTKLEYIYGKSVKDIKPASMHDELSSLYKKCAQTKHPVELLQDFGQGVIVVRVSPKIIDGKVVKIFGACTDVTEHVLEQKELIVANERLLYYENILREQLEFEALISRFSREFIEAGHKGFRACLHNMIKGIGKTLKTDQVFLIQYKIDDEADVQKHQWAKKKEWLYSKFFHTLYGVAHDGGYACFRSNKLLIVDDVEKESSINGVLKKALKEDGVKSILAVPILKDTELWGIIYLTQTQSLRMWTTSEIGMMKIAAQTIMSAYQRTMVEKQLEKSNSVLIEYDESLQELLAVEETIAKISKQFVSAGFRGFDACVDNMLEEIGELIGLDLTYLFLLNDKDKVFRNDYLWGAKGIIEPILKKHVQINEMMLTEDAKDNIIVIDNTMESKNAYPYINDRLLNDGIKSFLKVPIKKGNKVIGFLALHKLIGYHKWTNADIEIGKVFSEVFAGAYLRKQDEEELYIANKKLAQYEQEVIKQKDLTHKVAELVKHFIDANEDNFFTYAKTMCQKMTGIMNIDKVSLFKYTDDYLYDYMIFDWNSQFVASYNNIDSIERVQQNPEYNSHIMTVNTINTNNNEEKDSSRSKENYLGWNIKSALNIPIEYKNSVWGFIHIGVEKKGYEWKKAEIEKFKLFSEIWVRAYMRVFPDGLTCELGKIRMNDSIPEWETGKNEELA